MEKKKYTYNRLIDEGFPPHIAAGIVGNLDVESGFSDDVISFKRRGDQGSAYGIAQWRNDRKDSLLEFAGDRAGTLDGQIDYLIHELKTKPEYGYSELMKAKSAEEATIIFQNKFERPNKKYAHTHRRVKSAVGIYGQEDPNYVSGSYSTPSVDYQTTGVDNYLPNNAFQMQGRSKGIDTSMVVGSTTKKEEDVEDTKLSKKNEAKIALLQQEIASRQNPNGNVYEVQEQSPTPQPQPTYGYLANTELFRIT